MKPLNLLNTYFKNNPPIKDLLQYIENNEIVFEDSQALKIAHSALSSQSIESPLNYLNNIIPVYPQK